MYFELRPALTYRHKIRSDNSRAKSKLLSRFVYMYIMYVRIHLLYCVQLVCIHECKILHDLNRAEGANLDIYTLMPITN